MREGRAWGGSWAGAGSGRVGGAEGRGRDEHPAARGRGANDSGRALVGALGLATDASLFWIFLALIWPLRSGVGMREGIGAGVLAILARAARTRFLERRLLRSLFFAYRSSASVLGVDVEGIGAEVDAGIGVEVDAGIGVERVGDDGGAATRSSLQLLFSSSSSSSSESSSSKDDDDDDAKKRWRGG